MRNRIPPVSCWGSIQEISAPTLKLQRRKIVEVFFNTINSSIRNTYNGAHENIWLPYFSTVL